MCLTCLYVLCSVSLSVVSCLVSFFCMSFLKKQSTRLRIHIYTATKDKHLHGDRGYISTRRLRRILYIGLAFGRKKVLRNFFSPFFSRLKKSAQPRRTLISRCEQFANNQVMILIIQISTSCTKKGSNFPPQKKTLILSQKRNMELESTKFDCTVFHFFPFLY